MMNPSKYERQYFMPPETSLDWTKKEYITKALHGVVLTFVMEIRL